MNDTMQAAVAIRREDGTLGLFLRVVRAPSGIYVVFAAGQKRQRHDPHTSWHRDGRFHSKSFGRLMLPRRQRQPLDSIQGIEPFIATSVTRSAGPFLPDCDRARFDCVMEVDAAMLNESPNGTSVIVELVGPGATPAPSLRESRLVERFEIADNAPAIVVSFFDNRDGA